jgi:uncharacterized protein YjiS (DUF1127 family)
MNSNIDLGMRVAEPPRSSTSPVELRRQLEAARVLRAQVTASRLATGFRALGRPLRAPVAGAARWWRQRATATALMRCNDRVLADIGIERERIALVARGLDPRVEPSRTRRAWRRWPALPAHVEVLAAIQRGISDDRLRRDPQALADRA